MIDFLSSRLNMVFDMLPKEASSRKRVIDVGSDHGLFSLACLQTFDDVFCVCTDIHELPAKRTQQCLEENGYGLRVEVHNVDGLEGITLIPGDTIVMSGLGGNNIIHILHKVIPRTPIEVLKSVTFVLQPQKTFDGVRRFLTRNGFDIEDEVTCVDSKLHYFCIRSVFSGNAHELSSKDAFYGPILCKKFSQGDKDVRVYFDYLNKKYSYKSRSNNELRSLMEKEGLL